MERIKEQKKIKELEETIIKERSKLENIIKEMKIENYKSEVFIDKYIDKLKKVIKPRFWVEN